MKKRFGALLLIGLFLLGSLAGCMRMEATLDTTKSNKNYRVSMTVYFDKEQVDGLEGQPLSAYLGEDAGDSTISGEDLASITGLPVETIDGKQYYVQTEDSEKTPYFKDGKDKPKDGFIIRKDSFYAGSGLSSIDMDDVDDTMSDEYGEMVSQFIDGFTIRVAFSKKIKTTNGKLSANKKTVSFDYNFKDLTINNSKKASKEIYAYTVGSKSSLKEDREMVKEYSKKKKNK